MVHTFIVGACLYCLMISDALTHGSYIHSGSLLHCLMTSDALPHDVYIHSGSLPSFPHDIRCRAPWYVYSYLQPALISSRHQMPCPMVRTFIVAACLHFLMTSYVLPHGSYIHSGSLPSFPQDTRRPALPHGSYISGSPSSFPQDIRRPTSRFLH
jgi:hypothetical protein